MISVIIPTLNAEPNLAQSFAALVPGVVQAIVKEVIVVDGGSDDKTIEIADMAGATVLRSATGRGVQLKTGAEQAQSEWLLFLHADTVLQSGWEEEVRSFITRSEQNTGRQSAAAFRFALDDFGFKPRLLERFVHLRCFLLGLPYGDQGLLMPKSLYEELGGFRALPLMEDVDIINRLGRRRLTMLRSCAVTSAERYQKDGYGPRMLRNLSCLLLYYLKVPPRYLVRLYG